MLYPINMMNRFASFKKTSEMGFHDKSVLSNIKIWFYSKWMVSFKNLNISFPINHPSTSPSMTFFSKLHNFTATAITAKSHCFIACRKFFAAMFALSFVVNERPTFTSSWFFMPDSMRGIFPTGIVFNLRDFHSSIVSKLKEVVNGF